MPYRAAADAVLVLHLVFMLFVVLGGLLVLRWRRVMWLHVPAATWGALLALFGWPCPLTPLEQLLRRRAGQEGFEGGFIDHYLVAWIYPEGLARWHYVALGLAVLAVNAAIYTWIWKRPGRARRAPT